MKYAKKKPQQVQAWKLGAESAQEQALVRMGVIHGSGRGLAEAEYELFSREAVFGKGERALAGDYFRVEATSDGVYTYPIERNWFTENYRHLHGDLYETVSRPVAIWQTDDPPDDVVRFLLRTGRLQIERTDLAHYFRATLWGAPLSAARDAVVVFYHVDRDTDGVPVNVDFNFVARDYFETNYLILPPRQPLDSG